ncbi:MAG TPA: GxxExxY protein [Polyangia bacterium]
MGLEQEELTGSVIGAGIEVHKALGRGFLESVNENALASSLRRGVLASIGKPTLEIKRVIASQRPHHDFLAS